uniref:Anoctamin n=1 Tax=Macrostomum lignano TaxID=282301 RepID=A0A1I8HST1_9PLAT
MIIHEVLTKDLGVRKICAKWVPHILSEEQKAELKQQSASWCRPGSPRPVKAAGSIAQLKIMHVTFFDRKGIKDHVMTASQGDDVRPTF